MEFNLKDEWTADSLGPHALDSDKKSPFKFHVFSNLLDANIVDQLRNDIKSSIKLKPKDNDLYKFKQSKDIKSEIPDKKISKTLHKFIDVMLDQVRKHLEKNTGITLSDKYFDITASRYDTGDYLLCHNDDIKDNLKRHGRALAFIYYLNTRAWTEEDGGALAIFDSDATGEPVAVNNRILPKPNTLVVFETTPTSWHSVEEVTCKDDVRLSINGWFHTEDVRKIQTALATQVERSIEKCPFEFHRPIVVEDRIEKFFKEYFNQDYLMERTCLLIRKRFKRKSEINLTNFLVKEKFGEICLALKEATEKEDNLDHIGPFNKRNYKKLKLTSLPPVCKDLYDAFRSELFFLLLSRLTGLDLQPPSMKHDEREATEESDSSDEDDDDDDSEEEEEEEDKDEDEDDDDDSSDSEDLEHELARVSEAAKREGDKKILEEVTAVSGPTKRAAEEASTSSQAGASKSTKAPKKRKRTSDPLGRMEFRHLYAGAYTLIHDHGFELAEKSALDVILHFNHDYEVNFEQGGFISYIDGAPDDDLHDMDYELLTVEPKSNCLSLVYRCDEGTCRFLKHISRAHESNYQDLSCVYYERPDDLPNSVNPRAT